MSEAVYFTSPVGRLVWGSVSVPKTKDSKGNPLVVKKGPDIGKPAPRYEFGLAIPKTGETDWRQTVWGKLIYDTAVKSFPGGQYNAPAFSWKVTDGDSTQLTQKGRPAPCTREGHPGHWVLAFSSSFPPECLDRTGGQRIDPTTVKRGYYIQVAGSIKGNNGAESDGVYLNSKYVSLQAFGPEITVGPDPSSLGFGVAPLPAGASTTPVGAFVAPTQAAPAAPVAVQAPPVVPAVAAAPPAPSVAPTVVTPHTAILSPPTPPAPPVGPVMTPKAGNASYADFIAKGWTDTMMREQGYMV